MKAPRSHPAYREAPARYRAGATNLASLWAFLQKEAREKRGEWILRILPSGTQLALRDEGSHEGRILKIYRRDDTSEHDPEWLAEILSLMRGLGVLSWRKEAGATRQGGPMMTLTEDQRDLFEGGEF